MILKRIFRCLGPNRCIIQNTSKYMLEAKNSLIIIRQRFGIGQEVSKYSHSDEIGTIAEKLKVIDSRKVMPISSDNLLQKRKGLIY